MKSYCSGVFVGECSPNGRAKASGAIYPGLLLIEANGIDVKQYDFDSVMDILIEIPVEQDIELVFVDPRSVQRGPAILTVHTPEGQTVTLKCLKGQNLREQLLGSGIEVYEMKGKLTNCGGGGSCGTCAVEVVCEDWEPRPDFESKRLKKYGPNARLSCNTIIEGDAEVVVRPKKNGV